MLARRTSLLLALGMLSTGALPFVGSAHAAVDPATQLPAPGCSHYEYPKGDANLEGEAPNDPDLDITSLTLRTTATDLMAYIKVDKLDAGPSMADGHRFYFDFTFNGHLFTLAASAFKSGTGSIRDGLAAAGLAGHVIQLSVDGVSDTLDEPAYAQGVVAPPFVDSGSKAVFDTKNSYVVLSVPAADIAKYGKAAFAGALTAVDAKSYVDGYRNSFPADDNAPADEKYTIGDNKCFGPPAGKLTNVGAKTVQFTDAAALATKLTDNSGKALSGKKLTFALYAKDAEADATAIATATGTTGADGVAKATLKLTSVAGEYSLRTSFVGDSAAGQVDLPTPFTVTAEKTKVALSVVRSGAKRTVTARLLDDDGHAVAAQTITWYVNGKKVATSKTSSTGSAVLKTAKPGDTVKADYVGVTGSYLKSSATAKV